MENKEKTHEDYTPLYILTWNPDKFEWNERADITRLVQKYGSLSFIWSCRSKKPKRNDRFILLMQGQGEKNGIIGAGYFMTSPTDTEETPFGHRFARCELIYMADPDKDDYVRTKTLTETFPDQHWTPQMSGTKVMSKYTPKTWRLVEEKSCERGKNKHE